MWWRRRARSDPRTSRLTMSSLTETSASTSPCLASQAAAASSKPLLSNGASSNPRCAASCDAAQLRIWEGRASAAGGALHARRSRVGKGKRRYRPKGLGSPPRMAYCIADDEGAEDLAAKVLAAEHALDFPGAAVGPVDTGGVRAVLVTAQACALQVDLDADALVHGGDAVGSG